MKRFFAVVLLLTTAFAAAQSQTVNKTSEAERELRAIEEARREAIKNGDMKTLDAIYADDFSAIAGNGQIINKQQLFAVFKRSDPQIAFTTDEISVRVFKKTAVFTGRLIGRAADGKIVAASRFTHFFVRRGGHWRCVHGQSTPLPSI